MLILFQRREGQVACGSLLGNLCEEVATLHPKFSVLLVTICMEVFDDLSCSVGIERRGNQEYPTTPLLLCF